MAKEYLMWVGREYYEDYLSYVDEVKEMGVSKRINNTNVAMSIAKPNVLIYLAHDNGEFEDCNSCFGDVSCGDCRVRKNKISKLRKQQQNVLKNFEKEEEMPRGKKRIIEVRRRHIKRLENEIANCKICDGYGMYTGGTGGEVLLSDNTLIDYRTYNYLVRQPDKFNKYKEVLDSKMCAECGGTGKIPYGYIFGVFSPTRVEYICSGTEEESYLKKLKDGNIIIFNSKDIEDELERKCGFRHSGFYAVTEKSGLNKVVLKEFIKKIKYKSKNYELIGDFIFLKKVFRINGINRFRGVKKWSI